jgi:hypothetical protein
MSETPAPRRPGGGGERRKPVPAETPQNSIGSRFRAWVVGKYGSINQGASSLGWSNASMHSYINGSRLPNRSRRRLVERKSEGLLPARDWGEETVSEPCRRPIRDVRTATVEGDVVVVFLACGHMAEAARGRSLPMQARCSVCPPLEQPERLPRRTPTATRIADRLLRSVELRDGCESAETSAEQLAAWLVQLDLCDDETRQGGLWKRRVAALRENLDKRSSGKAVA